MADQTQTEQDTAKAQSRITRSGEYQKRADAANEKKASGGAASTRRQEANEPTAEEARKSRNDKNRTKSTQRDTDRAASRVTRSGEYQRRIDEAAEAKQVGTPQGNVNFVASSTTASSGGGGGGLGKGYMVLYADGESEWIDSSGFGSGVRSIYFKVENGAVVKGGQGSAEFRELWLYSEGDQVAAYIPIDYIADVLGVVDGKLEAVGGIVSTGGMYRETIICVNGEPVITFVRV